MVQITTILTQYQDHFPAEAERLAPLAALLQLTDFAGLFDRKTLPGHITASSLIVDPSRSSLLLIGHKTLNRWLQPGGHVDPGETPLQAALREAKEEIGIDQSDLTLIPPAAGEDHVPIDIDTHHIPANAAKHERDHDHHDFRYLFLFRKGGELAGGEQEAEAFKWIAFDELQRESDFRRAVKKIRGAM